MPEPAAPTFFRLKLVVGIHEARPNPMFTESQRALVRFLRYSLSIPCAECGKKKRALWTMLCSFQALDMAPLVPARSGKVHLPLTPVCQGHLLAAETEPALDPDGPKTTVKRKRRAGR